MVLMSAPASAAAGVNAPSQLPVEEILVTARKTEERLQDVPMSMQVLSEGFLDDARLTRLVDLQFNVPGLLVNSLGMHGAGFALRGVSSQGGGDGAVAAHVNGVYLESANLAVSRLFDLERIEVLKGPQGTLYGKNATGGTINFITRAPEVVAGADLEGAYGSFGTARLEGHVNVPYQDAAMRLAFVVSEGDGYIRNVVDQRRFAAADFWGLRAAGSVHLGDALHVEAMAQRVRDEGGSGELWQQNPAFLVDPHDIRLARVTLAKPYLTAVNDLVSLSAEYGLGSARLRSITGYAHSVTRNLDDCAGIPALAGCIRGDDPRTERQWSQELRLHWSGAGPVAGLIGLYYADTASVSHFHQFLPGLNPLPLNDSLNTTGTSTAAAFGQATYEVSARWSVTGGLRLSREEVRVVTVGTGVQDSPEPRVGRQSSDDLSWRLGTSFRATDEILLYLGAATGHKSGGFTTRLRDARPDGYAPEELTSVEAGARTTWLNRRLAVNVAAFRYDFEDLQVSTVTFIGDQLANDVDNAARAELYGVDLDGSWRASDRLTLSAGMVWMPVRKFVEFRNDETGDTLSGNTLVRAPEWMTMSAVQYLLPIDGVGQLAVRLEYNYRSHHYFTKENEPQWSQSAFGLLNAFVSFESPSRSWYAFASGRNLTNADYFHQVFLQSSPGYPATFEVGAGLRL